jgi:hypothetical protein
LLRGEAVPVSFSALLTVAETEVNTLDPAEKKITALELTRKLGQKLTSLPLDEEDAR